MARKSRTQEQLMQLQLIGIFHLKMHMQNHLQLMSQK